MAKYTYKEIKEIINNTPKDLKGKGLNTIHYEKRLEVGYYTPSYANWSYIVYIVNYNERLIEVATRFGWICEQM